uniref:Uncharacterized protein n=1 Tax=Arundo donax TaxID=35708 RepID=A0A0A8XZD9_ARUDO
MRRDFVLYEAFWELVWGLDISVKQYRKRSSDRWHWHWKLPLAHPGVFAPSLCRL